MDTSNGGLPLKDSEDTETRHQLASVRLLIQIERTVDFADIMLATIFEELEAGPKNLDELSRRIRSTWIGVLITRSMLEATLDAGRERHLLDVIVHLDGSTSWGLATIGRDELELSNNWADDVMERAANSDEIQCALPAVLDGAR